MNKKILTIGLGIIAVAALAGCSSGGGTSGSSGGSGSLAMTLVQGTKGSPFYEAMACGAQAQAKKLGVNLNVTAPDRFDASLMAPVLNSVTAQHPDAALVVPVDREALNSTLSQMKSAGIKLVEVDQTVSDPTLSVSKIASDDKAGGKLAADTLAKLIGEKGAVLVITNPPGSAAQDARTAAFESELKKYPNIKYLGAQYQQNDVAKAASIVTSTVAAHSDLVGVFSTNDIGAVGAVTGLEQAGVAGKVKLVAYDADAAESTALMAGKMQALIAQDPYTEGVEAVQQAYNSLKGATVKAKISTPLVSLTKDDAAQVKRYTYKGC
jgi:ribose transport system substrate-binding protein